MDLHQALWDLPEERAIQAWEDHAKEIVRTQVAEALREFGRTPAALSALRERLPAAMVAGATAAELLGRARARKVIAMQPGLPSRQARHAQPVAARGNPRAPKR